MDRLIEQLGLEQVRKNKGYMLSGGERRRVEIARSLVIEPSFLLLDEPFSGIDPIQVLELQKIIFDLKQTGIGILMTDHNVRETLAVTDRAYIINNGKIFRRARPKSWGTIRKCGACIWARTSASGYKTAAYKTAVYRMRARKMTARGTKTRCREKKRLRPRKGRRPLRP